MRFIVTAAVALGFAFAGPALAQPKTSPPAGASAERLAPVGHRQPQARNVPPDRPGDDTVKPEDRQMDRALKGICRGC